VIATSSGSAPVAPSGNHSVAGSRRSVAPGKSPLAGVGRMGSIHAKSAIPTVNGPGVSRAALWLSAGRGTGVARNYAIVSVTSPRATVTPTRVRSVRITFVVPLNVVLGQLNALADLEPIDRLSMRTG
jgi:hypothetical protein